MTREERENFVCPLIAASGARGLSLEAIVTEIVDTWEEELNERYRDGLIDAEMAR